MPASTSKLTKKYQATIPEPVRKALHLRAGDAITFDVEDGEVRLRKAGPVDLAFASAVEETLGEWKTEADEDAYRDL